VIFWFQIWFFLLGFVFGFRIGSTWAGQQVKTTTKFLKNQKMVIQIQGQQHSPFLPAIPYCFALHMMFFSFAFAKQEIRQPAFRFAPAGGFLTIG
jgi:hypothetical protein